MTSALLLWVASLGPPGEVPPEKVNAAIDRGVDWLLSMQRLDGSFGCAEPWLYADGGTALALYALLKCGVPKDHVAVRKALAFLERYPPPTRVYSAGCVLLALCEHDSVAHRARIAEFADFLAENGMSRLWAYPEGDADLSNTQYALLGLHAAASRARVRIPVRVWEEAVGALLERPTADGGFPYHVGGDPTGAMTVNGVAALALAQKHLDEEGRGARTANRTAETLRRAHEWLALHWSPRMNPEPRHSQHPKKDWDRWVFYWLYGVERAAAYADFGKIGDHDWYAEGAEFLLKRQDRAGFWGGTGSPEDEPNTSFALLFLRRASAPVTGERKTARWSRTFGRDDEKAAFSIRADGGAAMRLFVSSWGRRAREFEWPGEEGMGPRVARVAYLANEVRIAEVAGDPGKPAGAERFPAEASFDTNGKRTLLARATLALPGGGKETVESASVPVEVFDGLGTREREAIEDLRRNLVPEETPHVEASSAWDEGTWAAVRAADGLHSTGWLTKEEDASPWIRLTFRSPVQANLLKLAHALWRPPDPRRYARATEIAVFVNGARRAQAKLDPDDLRKHAVDLGGLYSIQALEIRILSRAAGHTHKGAVGFEEIELFRETAKGSSRRGG